MANFDKSANIATDLILKHFKERMQEKGITQYRLSKLTGIPEGTLSRNFRKENEMTLFTYLKICGALELRPYLIPAEIDTSKLEFLHFN